MRDDHTPSVRELLMLEARELLALHGETLNVLNAAGDMTMTNEPFIPGRRRAVRFHIAWNDSGIFVCYRDDVDESLRAGVRSWLESDGPTGTKEPTGLKKLGRIFDVPPGKIGIGPAYWTDERVSSDSNAVRITPENGSLLPDGFLDEGEIDFIEPAFAIIREDRAVSTCITVRRTDRSIEAGVDTQEAYRGRGYAGQATAAWVNAALDACLVPFYSTSSDNTASQRVAEKVGLKWFATELSIR